MFNKTFFSDILDELTGNYLQDMDSSLQDEIMLSLPEYHAIGEPHLSFDELEIPPQILSPRNDNIFRAVEAELDRSGRYRIRVIASITEDKTQGVNVFISSNSTLFYEKYRILKTRIRNMESVFISFPTLFITSYALNKALCLYTNDFLITDAADDFQPAKPYIEI